MSITTHYDTTNEFDLATHIIKADDDLAAWDYTLYRRMNVEVKSVSKKGNKLIIETNIGTVCTWKHNADVVSNLMKCDTATLFVCKRIKDDTLWTALTNWKA